MFLTNWFLLSNMSGSRRGKDEEVQSEPPSHPSLISRIAEASKDRKEKQDPAPTTLSTYLAGRGRMEGDEQMYRSMLGNWRGGGWCWSENLGSSWLFRQMSSWWGVFEEWGIEFCKWRCLRPLWEWWVIAPELLILVLSSYSHQQLLLPGSCNQPGAEAELEQTVYAFLFLKVIILLLPVLLILSTFPEMKKIGMLIQNRQ